MNGRYLNVQRDLGIGDDGRKKKCMSMTTCCAIDTDQCQCDHIILQLDVSFIVTMTDQASGMPTGTRDKVQIERIYRFIIKILRNKVVIFCFDCYHRKGYSVKTLCHGVGAEIKLWTGRFLLFLLVTIKYDSTRSLRIKQSDGKCARFSYAGTSFILHGKLKMSLL